MVFTEDLGLVIPDFDVSAVLAANGGDPQVLVNQWMTGDQRNLQFVFQNLIPSMEGYVTDTDLTSKLSGYSKTSHSHSEYALSSHTHAYAASSHKHSAADITSGTLPITRGGTGQTTAAAALKALFGTYEVISYTSSDISTYMTAEEGVALDLFRAVVLGPITSIYVSFKYTAAKAANTYSTVCTYKKTGNWLKYTPASYDVAQILGCNLGFGELSGWHSSYSPALHHRTNKALTTSDTVVLTGTFLNAAYR